MIPIRQCLGALSLAVIAGAIFIVQNGHAAERPAPQIPANASVAPDGPATLRSLATALATEERELAGRLTWRLLAAMARAKEQGTGPSEFLAAGHRAERLRIAESAPVQRWLLGAFSSAQTMMLFAPENLAFMDRGESPLATLGLQRGLPVIIDTGTPPEMTVKLQVGPKNFDRSRVTASTPASAAASNSTVVVSPTFEVKTFDVKLGEKLPLDSCGLTNFDLRLDRVDRTQGVGFVFENRLERSSTTAFSASFTPERIPGTTRQGVLLKTAGPASIYLDENLGGQVVYRIIVRAPR
jgi:hypothetical protein